MGKLRKMGAFLGLVPDDQQYEHGDAGDARDHGPSRGYHDGSLAADPDDSGSYDASSYESDSYNADSYGIDSHESSSYDSDPYTGDGGRSYAAASDSGEYADARATAGSAAYQAGYAGSYSGDIDHDAEIGRRTPAFAGPAGSISTARSQRSDPARGAGRGRESVDYQTHGALAVQEQSYHVEPEAVLSNVKPITVKLTGFGDARQVGEAYRDGQAVILDLTDLTDTEARRMVDFAAGLAFAVRGSIDKVTTKVFMLHQPVTDQSN